MPAGSSSTPGFDDADVAQKAATLIGIVGYAPVIDAFPLGRPLLEMLRSRLPVDGSVAIENMTWSPLHIVQQFQDPRPVPLERLVLIGSAAISVEPGRVRAFRWKGGKLPDQSVQDRIYEAVTGIVDIENTLVIGEHFGVWPAECFVVEADMPANTFGRMVVADSENWADPASLERHLGFSPVRMRHDIATVASALAVDGVRSGIPLEDKVSTAIASGTTFLRKRFASERTARGPR